MSSPLVDFMRDRIAARGPMPFAAFMSHALYHPSHGYYSAGPERSGWRGHFLTSPELDPAFGELWARGFEQIWESCGRPSPFTIVEVGPGEGGFARAVLGAVPDAFRAALVYRLIERVAELERRQRRALAEFERVEWVRSITECPPVPAGVVFANEVVDNMPVHLVEVRDEALFEVCVEWDGGALSFVALPPSSVELAGFLDRMGVALPEGHRMEVPLAAESFAARTAALLGSGASIVVDYGASAEDLAARPGGSLVAYSSAGVDDDVLAAPGERDVTAHANWTALAFALKNAGMAVSGPVPQRDVLRSLGLDDLHKMLRTAHDDAVAGGHGAEAVRALSRRQALGALSDPGGLGGLGVLAGTVAIEAPAFLAE